MKKVLLLGRIVNPYRFNRLKEELKKRRIKFDFLSTDNTIISNNAVFSDGKEINFSNFSAVFFLDDYSFSHYINDIIPEGVVRFPFSGTESKMADKFFEGILFGKVGAMTPKTVVIDSLDNMKLESLVDFVGGYPCVIKKVTGGHGKYVALVSNKKEVVKFIDSSSMKIVGKNNFILQEYIAESKGNDYRVLCLYGEIIGGIRRSTRNKNDFKANISLGGKAEKFDVPEDLAKICHKIMKEGNFLYAGIDFVKSNYGWLVIEINNIAQFEGFEKATGINVAGKIVEALIRKAQEKNKSEK